MPFALLLIALLTTGPGLTPPAPPAVASVPDEPGAFALPERSTYQAVAADLDGDGAPEVVRLVRGERGAIEAEAWGEGPDGWAQLGGAVTVIPGRPTGEQADVTYAGTPARLIARAAGGSQRVTLVRQPRFEELEQEGCCLLLDDLVLADGALRLTSVAVPQDGVNAVLALDLDGDGTDELLTSLSLPPLGDISFPSRVSVYRWDGNAFADPTVTELPVGSGTTPSILGDSDGRPGVEAAVIASAGPSRLYRLSLGADDAIVVEDSDLVVSDARAVPMGDGAVGIAISGPTVGLATYLWPAGQPPEPFAQEPLAEAMLIGTVELASAPGLLAREPSRGALHVLQLPSLRLVPGPGVARSPAAATLESSPIDPYVGVLPGGGTRGEASVIYEGRLLPGMETTDSPSVGTAMGAMAGVEPIGLVGADRRWLALLHAPLPVGRLDPSGGRLDAPVLQPAAAVTLAPLHVALTPEADDGRLEPSLDGATPIGSGRELAVARDGMRATVAAPAGSRIYVADADPSAIGDILVVPDAGRVEVPIRPAPASVPNPRSQVSLSVVTPAGHAYVARWQVRVLTDPPALEASAATELGSTAVEISGRTAPYATVRVGSSMVPVAADGTFRTSVDLPPWPTAVGVIATDPAGNESRTTVSGVGLFDYRGLPWIPIAVVLVGAAGVLLFLRVPRVKPLARRHDDDARLEELEPD